MYSFDTPGNNPLGLDVCLSCFQAFARTDAHNWTAKHYSKTRHSVFLNILKELKPESERPSPFNLDLDGDIRLAKAPKLEILLQSDLDLYNTTNRLYVAPLDAHLNLDDAPESTRQLATEILNANSASTDIDITAWEHEVFPCEHSETLDLMHNSNVADTSKCRCCELTTNLWVCLTCGAVSCGREQFGSDIKGNSHGLAHYEQSKHTIAVRLGSLSSDENKCDCYCYKCNDEVKVPGLASNLRSFGIDLANAVKSEKTLVELNLETNKNWQFTLDGADGEKMTPVFGLGLTGMKNLGNTCYLNSVVQALFSIPNYRQFFSAKSFDESVPNPAEDMDSQLIKLFDGLVSGRYSKPNGLKGDLYQEGIKPDTFKSLIGKNHSEFRTTKQQDANEFLLFLLDSLDKLYGLALNKDFKFVFGSKLVCNNCNSGSITSELVDTISLPLKVTVTSEEDDKKIYKPTSFEECFQMLAAQESIEQYLCEACGKQTEARKQSGFQSFPKYLLTSLQRVQLENGTLVKVEVPVELPEQIDLSVFKMPEFEAHEKETVRSKVGFVPNPDAMSNLRDMGFGENRCIRALYHTENKSTDEAMDWIFAHMDDVDIDSPFSVPSNREGARTVQVSQEAIDNIASMGFAVQLAHKALYIHLGDANSAVEWLFNNPDDDGVIEEKTSEINIVEQTEALKEELLGVAESSAQYKVKAVVCHKGSSPLTGHYVVFIRVDDRWVLFNDEKVLDCGGPVDEMQSCGYIYLLEKI